MNPVLKTDMKFQLEKAWSPFQSMKNGIGGRQVFAGHNVP